MNIFLKFENMLKLLQTLKRTHAKSYLLFLKKNFCISSLNIFMSILKKECLANMNCLFRYFYFFFTLLLGILLLSNHCYQQDCNYCYYYYQNVYINSFQQNPRTKPLMYPYQQVVFNNKFLAQKKIRLASTRYRYVSVTERI